MMKRIVLALGVFFVIAPVLHVYAQEKPMIRKRGTIDCDMVEATPLVFNGRLYRFEYVREQYKPNTTGDSYFRFVDTATGQATPPFAKGYHLGSAHVEGDTAYAYGVPAWGASTIDVFWSKDLVTWRTQRAFTSAGWGIYNTGMCKDAGKYVMAIEIGEPPEETGVRFTIRFATSTDLLSWTATPSECVYSKEKYTACPALAFLDDGYYYMIYLEAYPGAWAPHIVRSKDLAEWEDSPHNPIMKHSGEDKAIANPKLTAEQREHIAGAKNVNNSDVDFCEWKGQTVITYSWGDQHGTEFLAEALYPGPVKTFLQGYFPE